MRVFSKKDVFSALIHYILYTRAREEGEEGKGGERDVLSLIDSIHSSKFE